MISSQLALRAGRRPCRSRAERLRYDQADPNLALEQFGVLRRANLRLLVRAAFGEGGSRTLRTEQADPSGVNLNSMREAVDIVGSGVH